MTPNTFGEIKVIFQTPDGLTWPTLEKAAIHLDKLTRPPLYTMLAADGRSLVLDANNCEFIWIPTGPALEECQSDFESDGIISEGLDEPGLYTFCHENYVWYRLPDESVPLFNLK